MKISLITTCYDRQTYLDRFTSGLANQTFQDEIELIFVSQGTAQLRLPADCAARIDFVERKVGHQISLSGARNIGLEKFSGDIIGFPDDDCWYEKELLQKVVSYFESNPHVDCLCTNVFDPDRQLSIVRQPVGVVKKLSFRNVFQLVNSSGIFIRRGALLRIGPTFDERLGVGTKIGSGEETEFLSRVLSNSLTAHYVGTIQVYHPVVQYLGSNLAKEYAYNIGFGVLNGWFIRRGHYSVLFRFARSLLRSCLGALVFVNKREKRKTYWSRVRGMVAGLISGLRNGATEEKHSRDVTMREG